MQDLNVAIVQTSLVWEDRDANLGRFHEKLDHLPGEPDIVVLPEMFSTGFTMNAAHLAEAMDGPTVAWMRQQAQQRGFHLIGSVIIEDGGRFYNRLIWAHPDGSIGKYDKRHLFRMAREERVYSAGRDKLVVELHGWKICPFICYDLRFPVWLRNLGNHYDVAIFIANWPAKRSAHWRSLLVARAIENQAYVIGVNRIGEDGHGYAHSGDSMVLDPAGDILLHARNIECLQTIPLSYSRLQSIRESFPVWKDADDFELRV